MSAALAWCQQQPIDDIGPVSELEGNIFALSVEHIEAPGVAERLAQAMLQRCRWYRGFPVRRHSKEKSPEEVLREDDVRRRRFLAAFVPLLNPANVHILMHPLSILNGKGFGMVHSAGRIRRFAGSRGGSSTGSATRLFLGTRSDANRMGLMSKERNARRRVQ